MATNAPWYMTNEQIRKKTKIATLEELIDARTEKLIKKVQVHQNLIIRNITNTPRQRKTNTHMGIINNHSKRRT